MRGGLALLLAACASRGELEARHAPSRVEMPSPDGDFAAYVAQSKAQIAAANRAIGKELDPQVLEDRAPFELAPDPERCPRTADGRQQRAALLIHGLGETPYAMRALGERFAAACFLVRAILLPGHGTVPGDLLEVGHADWVEATRAGAQSFAGLTERLYLVGFASGGTLALDYALGEPPPIAPGLGGLVLLAPAIATRSGHGRLTRDHLAPGALMPAGGFAQLLPDEDPVRYGSLARNAERQLDALIERVDDRERLLALPVFMALSAADAVVEFGGGAALVLPPADRAARSDLVRLGRESAGRLPLRRAARERSVARDPRSRPPGPADRARRPALRSRGRVCRLRALLLGDGHACLADLRRPREDAGELGGPLRRDHRAEPGRARRPTADLQSRLRCAGRPDPGVHRGLAMARPAAARAQAGDMMIRAGTPPVVRVTFVC